MKLIKYSNRFRFALALIIELAAVGIFVYLAHKYRVPFEFIVVFSLITLIAFSITCSGLWSPVTYIFAHDNVKFGFMQNDKLIIEGYFLDIELVSRQHGLMGYQSEITTTETNGYDHTPFIVGSKNDLIIQLKGQKPMLLPKGFKPVYKEFLRVYKASV